MKPMHKKLTFSVVAALAIAGLAAGFTHAQVAVDPSAAERTETPSGEDAYLGFQFRTIDGVTVINRVDPGGIADLAGLREGDRIISIDGQQLANRAALNAYLQGFGRGQFPVVIERDGQRRTVQLPAAPRQANERRGALGVRLIDDSAGNVWVAFIHVGGPADEAGIVPGDRLVSVNGQSYNDKSSASDAIGRTNPGDDVTLRIERGDELRTVTVTLEPWDEAFDGRLIPSPDERHPLACRNRTEGNETGAFTDQESFRKNDTMVEQLHAEIIALRRKVETLENELETLRNRVNQQ